LLDILRNFRAERRLSEMDRLVQILADAARSWPDTIRLFLLIVAVAAAALILKVVSPT